MTTKTHTRPTMTADQATMFPRYSPANAATVKTVLDCGCEPYQDVFTYNRWKAQGYQVMRGQRAVKIPVIVTAENEDGEAIRRLWRSAVFCRHQVKRIGEPDPEPARPLELYPTFPIKTEPEPAPAITPEPAPAVNNSIPDTDKMMQNWRVI